MAELTFLRDLTVVMVVSAVITVSFHVLRQPAVLGYLVAGVLIGPHTPPFSFVTDLHSIHTLAELGIVLLLFSLGLEFDLKKLRQVGVVAVLAAVLEILFMLWLGYTAGQLLGWPQMESLFLGALLSISSTTIIVQVLIETGQLREPFAQIILGILIVEDIAAILILVVLSGLASAGTITMVDVGWALLRVSMFMATALLVGIVAIPRLLTFVARFQRSEMLTVTVLGLAFGLAVLGAQLGFSVALGAFLMGAIMAEAKEAHEIVERIGPIREMFTAVFFVATGMLLDPLLIMELWQVILLLTGLTVAGKIVSCAFGTFLAGYPGQVAIPVGLGMAQIGEFSFIIANLGRSSGVTSGTLYPIAVAVSSVTTLLTPYLLRSAYAVTAALARICPRPLLTFATFYTAWVTRLATRTLRSDKVVQGLLLRLLLYLAVAVSLFVVAWGGLQPLVHALPEVLPHQRDVLQWGGAAAVALPFLFLINRTFEQLIQQIKAVLLPRRTEDTAGQAQFVRHTLQFLFGWVAAVFVLAISSPVLPPLVPLGVVGLGLLITTYLFWDSLTRFHARIEGVLSILSGEDTQSNAAVSTAERKGRTEVTQLLSDRYGLAAQTEDFVMPLGPTALNRPIQSLALRTLTGASIIAIYRDPEQILVPQADTVLLPGDVLVLLGEREQLEAALRLLTEMATQKGSTSTTPPQVASLSITEDSPFAHHTLAELGLREELDVLIVGVQRGATQVANPGSDFRVQAGDRLYLWGAPEQVAAVLSRAGASAEDSDEQAMASGRGESSHSSSG
ncbi:MAG TPA: cation:proton antiporter [Candidatus Binatia bacterium]|jgi:CPA2 family monovalent cation:H+ antiporter-2|nr:cation:proton antiporter [Candidatus Binatia bacterium]